MRVRYALLPSLFETSFDDDGAAVAAVGVGDANDAKNPLLVEDAFADSDDVARQFDPLAGSAGRPERAAVAES